MSYEIGQTFPLEAEPITGEDIKPTWFALHVPQRKDFAAVSYLRNKGMRAFAPEKTTMRRQHGKRFQVILPALPGIVYAQFAKWPHFHAMRARRLITGVMSRDGDPIVIPDAQIGRIKGLAKAMEEQEAERISISAGDRIRIIRGLFEGYTVDVSEVRGGLVWMEGLGLGRIGVKPGDVVKEE